MYNPVSTYRIQFHRDFKFKDLAALVPYLENLGIRTLYASPIFKAVPGSQHGYDGVDPLQINPEIGTLAELRELAAVLKSKGIGWIQDIVPNHLAFHSANAWLMDVLEKGLRSNYRHYFDINNVAELPQQPLMVPFLGSDLPEVIKNGELRVVFRDQKFFFDYAGNTWPLNLRSYTLILGAPDDKPPGVAGLLAKIKTLEELTKPLPFNQGMEALTQEIQKISKKADFKAWINLTLAAVNQDEKLLASLAAAQYYRLCSWQETDQQINYRRFFTVNGLICLNMQRPEVFDAFHGLIARLVQEKVFDGLRVDHIDGLYDPAQYLKRLRRLVGSETFISVEKILESGETMPQDWPVQGNTGYDFLAQVNNLLTNRKGEAILRDFYQQATGETRTVPEQVADKKRLILTRFLAGEWQNLVQLFTDLQLAEPQTLKELGAGELKEAIGRFLISCPVYRFYGNAYPLPKREVKIMRGIFKTIRKNDKALAPAVKVLETTLLDAEQKDADYQAKALSFFQRCMQFSGPLMAKGVEDTLMYTENHFIAHNEVGDSPEAAGLPVKDFHILMRARRSSWPLGMNATATHDTKRGEDVRARLQVLPELAGEWQALVLEWQKKMPSKIALNDAIFIFQTLLGAMPANEADLTTFRERLNAYLEKTLREGKEHSDWAAPAVSYEQAAKDFSATLLARDSKFWKSFEPFFTKVSDFGIVNSLAQLILKFTCPGIPDIYQGCEHWDFSLVDPDNRRPVDYRLRQRLLNTEVTDEKALKTLWQKRQNGQLKVWLTQLLARERSNLPLLFEHGDYLPLVVTGKYRANLMAFARKYQQNYWITMVPLGLASLMADASDVSSFDWSDTAVELPAGLTGTVTNILTTMEMPAAAQVKPGDLFTAIPFALLRVTQPVNKRRAGVLMPLASLPSRFGIGDLGPGARNFADKLHQAGQKLWQLLPLTPVSRAQQYSPYSSHASFAGNEWLISPELLAENGLLPIEELAGASIKATGKINYAKAETLKTRLLTKAWENFKAGAAPHLEADFKAFREREKDWLDDYALYVEIHKSQGDTPWYQWPKDLRLREDNAITQFASEHSETLLQIKWFQFIFDRQLSNLKAYVNRLGIALFGDLPFYVGYDSADAWAGQELFSLDKTGQMKQVAGVPPDYFNADGQLWGMPVYNWDALKKQNFDWWLRRISRNLQYVDVLRLDHFRAFASYWAVPAAESTAVNGNWVKGPGRVFFEALKKGLGELPLVAEDLGDIDDEVYNLRDAYQLPGMKVLQFAWGGTAAVSPHMPHNYTDNFVAYTGTHDNNTTRGWYRLDIEGEVRQQLREYLGDQVKGKNVAKALIRQATASVADTVIIPLQDWLNLPETARLNVPAGTEGNWIWQVSENELAELPLAKMKKMALNYNRL